MTLEVEREEAVQALCAHYAQDHLTTGELEHRFERVYGASTAVELRTVFEGLPALRQLPAVAGAPLYAIAPPSAAPARPERRYLALFSGVKKEGAWIPSATIRGRVMFGELVLDFREALIPPEGVDIDVNVTCGACRVLLPPGLGADVDATAIMGSVVDKAQRPHPGAPVVRVTGSVLMGEVVVQTKLPKPARMESWRRQLKALFGSEDDGTGGEWF